MIATHLYSSTSLAFCVYQLLSRLLDAEDGGPVDVEKDPAMDCLRVASGDRGEFGP